MSNWRFQRIDKMFLKDFKTSPDEMNMRELFQAINETPPGEFIEVDVPEAENIVQLRARLVKAYNFNQEFVVERGFGLGSRVLPNSRKLRLWKVSAEEVLYRKAGHRNKLPFGDRTQL